MASNESLANHLNHLAIIMDGNGRWAQQRGFPRLKGHDEGAKRVMDISTECKRLGIQTLSLFAFSTENWSRSKQEVNGLFIILETFAKQYKQKLLDDHVRLVISGDLIGLPSKTRHVIEDIVEATKDFTTHTLNICLNYGGLQEIVEITKRIALKVQSNELSIDAIQESTLMDNTWQPSLPPIDCLIRTSGEQRLSNFMLLHLAYSELVFVDTYWPDFTVTQLHDALATYQQRHRRFGKER
jgi:undecaprenyl diphosphate synthase